MFVEKQNFLQVCLLCCVAGRCVVLNGICWLLTEVNDVLQTTLNDLSDQLQSAQKRSPDGVYDDGSGGRVARLQGPECFEEVPCIEQRLWRWCTEWREGMSEG